MKKRLRRQDLPNATDGLADRRRKREFRALMRVSDAAYVTKRFKAKKGQRRRRFPNPVYEWRIQRAERFNARVDSAQQGLTESHPA